MEEDSEGSAVLVNLKNLVENDDVCLVQQLHSIARVSDGLCKQIKVLESDDINSTQVWLILSTVCDMLQSCGVQCKKLCKYMNGGHVATDFWKQVQFLDPTRTSSNSLASGLPIELKRFSNNVVPLEEISMYRVILSDEEMHSSSVFSFWKKQSTKMPILSQLAMNAATVPPSSASVERSFSTLSWILNSRRTSLTPENVDAHVQLAYNQQSFIEED